jgi:putative transposase
VLGSLGSTGDAYDCDDALAESFVDSFKTELIADRTWRSIEQAELAIVEWVSWFNQDRLHSSIGDIPPVEFEQNYRERVGADPLPGSTPVSAL